MFRGTQTTPKSITTQASQVILFIFERSTQEMLLCGIRITVYTDAIVSWKNLLAEMLKLKVFEEDHARKL